MIKMFSVRSRINRKYRSPKDSIYAHRFFRDLSSGYSFTLGEKGENRDFFSFEPKDCRIVKLLKSHRCFCSSYEMEQIINRIAYCLIAYGKAYLFIRPKYTIKQEDDKTETEVLSSFEIEEIEGIIKKKSKKDYLFSSRGFNGTVNDISMPKKQLIIFDIKDLGLSSKYFPSILKKLSRYDIAFNSTDMITNNADGYDFENHSNKNKLAELKASRHIGWSFGTEKLSDSYILFKKIQEDELKIRFLDYIVKKINDGLSAFLGDGAGKLVAHINRKNYNQLWNDYSEGKITGTELTNILFRN